MECKQKFCRKNLQAKSLILLYTWFSPIKIFLQIIVGKINARCLKVSTIIYIRYSYCEMQMNLGLLCWMQMSFLNIIFLTRTVFPFYRFRLGIVFFFFLFYTIKSLPINVYVYILVLARPWWCVEIKHCRRWSTRYLRLRW